MYVCLSTATFSSSVVNFNLKKRVNENEDFDSEVPKFIKREFYIDVGLKSVTTVTTLSH